MYIKKRKIDSHEIDQKFDRVLTFIENYHTDRLIRNEDDLERLIHEYLRNKLGENHVEFQKRVAKGRIDIVIDNEIAIELKIADNRRNLNSLFGQIEWYKEIYDKLALVILDIDRIPDMDDFIKRFEDRGVEVVILTSKNIRFKRSNRKNV